MNADIISRVSQIIIEEQHDVKLPRPKKEVSKKGGDSVQISSVASDAGKVDKALDKVDTKRTEKVEALKQKIEKKEYHFNEQVIDTIAQNIAEIFI